MPSIDVLPVGAEAAIIPPGCEDFNDGVPATITGVMIEAGSVSYRCVWWDGSNRRCEWISSVEIASKSGEKRQSIGFKL